MTSANPYRDRPWVQHHYAPAARDFAGQPFPLAEMLSRNVQLYADRPCVSYKQESLTFAEVEAVSDQLGAALQSLGIGKGDCVGYCMANHPIFVSLYFALWKIGAVGVGFNPLYPADRLRDQAEDCNVKAIVTGNDRDLIAKLVAVQAGASSTPLILCVDTSKIDPYAAPILDLHGDAERVLSLASLLVANKPIQRVSIDVANDLAALSYTGGTTGVPKGVMLTHANLSINAQQAHSWWPELVPGEEAIFAAGPFTHISGVGPLLDFASLIGMELVVVERFNASEALDLIGQKTISVLLLNPTMCVAFLQQAGDRSIDWSGVKVVQCGAAPLTPDIRQRFLAISGKKVFNLYGMTETSPGMMQGLPDIEAYATAVGCPLPDTDVEIRSVENSSELMPVGEVGELCVRGPQVMGGYWNKDEENAAFFVDGFFRTGDLAYMTPDGVFFIVDRLKDVIIASGYNIYPTQVENVLTQHPAIKEAAIIGVDDDYRGQTIKAIVSLRDGASLTLDQLKTDLAGKLSPMEIPKILEILDELPKTPNLKISREALKQRERELMEVAQ